jgi:hypothetical protein
VRAVPFTWKPDKLRAGSKCVALLVAFAVLAASSSARADDPIPQGPPLPPPGTPTAPSPAPAQNAIPQRSAKPRVPEPSSPARAAYPDDQEAQPPERPPSGVGFLVSGGILTGLGPLTMLASLPACGFFVPAGEGLLDVASLGRTGTGNGPENACWEGFLITGGVLLAAGLPLLIVGGIQRQKYDHWRYSQPGGPPGIKYRIIHSAENVTVLSMVGGGVALGWHTEF